MYVTRAAFSAGAARAYALDLEFVKFNNAAYARSAAFVPFRRVAAAAGDALPQLTELVERPVVLELSPEVTLRLAEPLPCGHLLTSMVDALFAATPALCGVLQKYRTDAEDELHSYRSFRKALREMKKKKKNSKVVAEKDVGQAEDDPLEKVPESGAEMSAEDDEAERSEPSASSFDAFCPSSSAPSRSVDLTSAAEIIVARTFQMRVGIVQNFKGIDPYAIPNVRRFNKAALELLHAAPVGSHDFKRASEHLSPLRSVGRGKNGYKGLAFCTHTHPDFTQQVLRTVFDSPRAWYEWLTSCHDCVAEDLKRVRNAHRIRSHSLGCRPHAPTRDSSSLRHGSSSSSSSLVDAVVTPYKSTVEFRECDSLEDLAWQMNVVWAKVLCEKGMMNTTATQVNFSSQDAQLLLSAPPPKVFVYGSVDRSVIHRTLALSTPPVAPPWPRLSEHRFTTRRFRKGSRLRTVHAGDSSARHSSSLLSEVASATSEREGNELNNPLQLVSPLEVRVVDLTQHPLFTASGFAMSPKKTPSLSRALEKAATRDATASVLHASQQQHDPLWDAQALACLCSTAGVVRSTADQ
jgi:hypothetical protein